MFICNIFLRPLFPDDLDEAPILNIFCSSSQNYRRLYMQQLINIYTSTLKMEAAYTSETLVTLDTATRCNYPRTKLTSILLRSFVSTISCCMPVLYKTLISFRVLCSVRQQRRKLWITRCFPSERHSQQLNEAKLASP
jgi:hypothetical protein